MTTESPARPRAKRPGAFPVVAATVATFLVVIALLAVQLRNGEDPAIGAGSAAAPAPKQVLVRRIIKRKVIVRVIPRESQSGGGGSLATDGALGAAPAVQAAARPSPTPAAAPAPAPAAPAPAPAAPVTRSS
jgi:hypothetical protein